MRIFTKVLEKLSTEVGEEARRLIRHFYALPVDESVARGTIARQIAALPLPKPFKGTLVVQLIYNALLTDIISTGDDEGIKVMLREMGWLTSANIKLLAYHLERFYYPNNLAGGLELLSLLLPLCPDNYVPHALLGDFLRKQQRHHESIARYRQAEELYDEKFDYHISLTHIQLGIAYDYLELARRVMQPNQKKSYLNQCRWELAICELLPWPTEREERRYYTATVLWGMTSYEHFNDFDALCQAKTATERLQVLTMTERSQRIIGLFNQTVELAIQRSRKK